MKIWISRNKYLFFTLLVIIILGVIVFINQQMKDEQHLEGTELKSIKEEKSEEESVDRNENHTKIFVDIKGQIQSPGIYSGKEGERVQDLISRAGGFLENADQNQVNLAQKIHDEMVIYIPKKGEKQNENLATIEKDSVSSNMKKININTSNSEELQQIPGVGPAKANAIIEYRSKDGLFKKIEDIKNISGIGEKTFEKLKNYITIE